LNDKKFESQLSNEIIDIIIKYFTLSVNISDVVYMQVDDLTLHLSKKIELEFYPSYYIYDKCKNISFNLIKRKYNEKDYSDKSLHYIYFDDNVDFINKIKYINSQID